MRLLISGYGGNSGDVACLYNYNNEVIEWESNVPSLSFMCYDSNSTTLFAVEENESDGAFHLFTSEGGHSSVKISTSWLCHVTYSAKHQLLIGSSYGNGEIYYQHVLNGALRSEANALLQNLQANDRTDLVSRAHCAVLSECEDYVYSTNLGLDCLFIYKITNAELIELATVRLKSGVGPRHICLSGSFMYVTCEYSNEVILLHLESPTIINVVAYFPALPTKYSGDSCCSDLSVTQDNRFLLVANRGANLITVFNIASNGFLEAATHFSCYGDWPRYIALLNDDTILGICNQRSNYLSLVAFDSTSGSLLNEVKRVPFEGVSFVSEYIVS